jgi:hypothetical protein
VHKPFTAFSNSIFAGLFALGFQSCFDNSSGGAADKSPRATAHWDFDDCASENIRDKSGNGLDGLVHGAVCAEGIKGKALRFNGTSDYVHVGKDSLLDLDSNMTLSAWIRPADMQATDFWYEVVSKRITQSSAYGFNIKVGGGAAPYLQWYFGDGRSFHVMGSNSALTDDVWTHVALTRTIHGSATKMKVFVNGNLVDTATIGVLPEKFPGSPFTIVRNGDPLPNPASFKGSIDEVSVYDRALDPLQVSGLYRTIKP